MSKKLFPIRNLGRMQGWAFNLRRPLFQDVRLRRAFNLAFDWEEEEPGAIDRRISPRFQLFRRHSRPDGHRPAGRQGAGDTRDRARQGAARGLHDTVQGSRQRQSGECAQQSARGRAPAEGSRLRDQGPQTGRFQRPAGQCRNPQQGPGRRTHRAVLQTLAGAARRHYQRTHRRRRAISESPAQFRFRPRHHVVGRSRSRRATSSANSSAQLPPTVPAAATAPASRILPSTH